MSWIWRQLLVKRGLHIGKTIKIFWLGQVADSVVCRKRQPVFLFFIEGNVWTDVRNPVKNDGGFKDLYFRIGNACGLQGIAGRKK